MQLAAAEQRTRYYPTTYSGSVAPARTSYCYASGWAYARRRPCSPVSATLNASRCLRLPCFRPKRHGTSPCLTARRRRSAGRGSRLHPASSRARLVALNRETGANEWSVRSRERVAASSSATESCMRPEHAKFKPFKRRMVNSVWRVSLDAESMDRPGAAGRHAFVLLRQARSTDGRCGSDGSEIWRRAIGPDGSPANDGRRCDRYRGCRAAVA